MFMKRKILFCTQNSLPLCLAVAVAAVKLVHPVRLNLDRYVDMSITGHQHPFKIQYRIAFNNEDGFLGLCIQMWNNAGCTLDASKSIMKHAMLHMGNAYQFSNIRIHGRVSFHGYGGPQAMIACEIIVEHVAAYLKYDPLTIRCLNLFKEGDITHFGQVLEQWNVPRIMNELRTLTTDKIHNTSPTGGSFSSDLNGMAVKHACQQIRQRLDTVITDNNVNISWNDLVKQAYFVRIDLCALRFYMTPNMFDADFTENQANYNYFTQGATVT
ncbi:unnamed protein product [Rotaria sp. Silwood1]|nr:unnamed protein product [Rotaria sp. Silwood1]